MQVGVYEIENSWGNKVDITSTGCLATTPLVRLIGVTIYGTTLDTNFWASDLNAGGTYTQVNGMGSLITNTTANGNASLTTIRTARYITGFQNLFKGNVDFGTTPALNRKRWGAFTSTYYNFTITSASATIGAVYSNNGFTYTVLATIVSQTTLQTYGTGIPLASGTLTLVSGTGAATITYSAELNQNLPSNGAMFEMLNGPNFSVSLYKAGVRYKYALNGGFNGDHGLTLDTFPSTINSFKILYRALEVRFIVNDQLLHYFDCTDDAWTEYLHFPIRYENVNYSNATTNTTLRFGGTNICRLGEWQSQPTYKYISTATTTVLKYGAGSLHAIINATNTGSITIYDSTSGAGLTIGTLDGTRALGSIAFDCPFYYGLTIVSTAGTAMIIIYE